MIALSEELKEERKDIELIIDGKNTDFLVNMSASADVLAQAKVEIDLAAIPEGKNVSRLSSLQSSHHVKHLTRFPSNRSSSNGAASPSSSATAPPTRSKKPKTPNGNHYGTRNPTRIVSRSPTG